MGRQSLGAGKTDNWSDDAGESGIRTVSVSDRRLKSTLAERPIVSRSIPILTA